MTGHGLKLIAAVTMFVDHFAASVIERMLEAERLTRYLEDVSDWGKAGALGWAYIAMRLVGRIAFPVFLFLLAEGVRYTKSKTKYLLRMAIFAFVSEIPFDMAMLLRDDQVFSGKLLYFGYQNVFFTLTVSLAVMCICDWAEKKFSDPLKQYALMLAATAAGATLAWFLKTDYGAPGVVAAATMYMLRYKKTAAFAAGVAVLIFFCSYNEAFALLALPFICKYNGQRGRYYSKYLYYLFYPAHLLLLWGICIFCGLLK